MLSLYRPLTNLLRDDFIDREFGSLFGGSPATNRPTFTPAVDIVDKGDAYLLVAELPGLDPSDIHLSVENNVLTLSGERGYDREQDSGGYRRVERRYGSFSRAFTLPEGTSADAIDAHSDKGVLTVTIPKVVTAPSRKVEIKTGGLVDKAKQIFAKTGSDDK
jgi:HSP20 family protein